MGAKHELEIEITPGGEVKVHVKGAKGKECMEYLEIFKSIGEVKDQSITSEYYETPAKVGITEKIKNRFAK